MLKIVCILLYVNSYIGKFELNRWENIYPKQVVGIMCLLTKQVTLDLNALWITCLGIQTRLRYKNFFRT